MEKPATRQIPLATKYGPTLLSMSNETRAYTHATHNVGSKMDVDGITCSVRVGLQVVDGKWVVSRTEAGNESLASLDVRVPSPHSQDLHPAALFHRVS